MGFNSATKTKYEQEKVELLSHGFEEKKLSKFWPETRSPSDKSKF